MRKTWNYDLIKFPPDLTLWVEAYPVKTKLPRKFIESWKKKPAWEKVSDAAFTFTDPESNDEIIGVVFEAGFSENYEDLLSDMRQWLLRSDDDLQLVIIVNIQEDRKSLEKNKSHNDAKDRIASLLQECGSEKGKDDHSDILHWLSATTGRPAGTEEQSTFDDSESDAELYTAVKGKLDCNDWVGPLTVELEYWELKDSRPQRRGDKVRVIPAIKGDIPSIYISEAIPLLTVAKWPSLSRVV
ncbi:hypothetical protein P175DRAFT_0535790 [Aspergillus ochraceoroseus IBT 24754]|uniref:Uncharacterized protein n=1 Tax=Aspergillus ochraceoroseus IBT 24754 TaxID=1392256 RepID=A0A2T5LMF1_9EURO|nr:uncharacterized protein P175DRAFT_0535790 [Aspergillus ochraceoroseus IBT 24754]PTU17459.1 hypothetical protein P175DRAFT_0535790 [Aspergillus ochraceoroseus IBT 24754]